MPTSRDKLAAALTALHRLQEDGSRVFRSRQLKRSERERLVKHGFLREVIKGAPQLPTRSSLP